MSYWNLFPIVHEGLGWLGVGSWNLVNVGGSAVGENTEPPALGFPFPGR